MNADAVHEMVWAWWTRVHEIAPWSWRSDPYLEGMDADTFNKLRDTTWGESNV